jgi:hypothetical protein
LVRDYHIDDVFALNLEPIENGVSSGGTLTLGGYDLEAVLQLKDNRTGIPVIYYTPIMEESYYVVQLNDVKVDNLSVRHISSSSPHFGVTVIDSGTTYIILPSNVYSNIKKIFQTQYCNIEGSNKKDYICGEKNIFNYGTCIPANDVRVL